MKIKFFYNPVVFFFALLVCACRRESPTTWENNLLVPLATGRITLDEIVADSLLEYDDQCLWHLILHEDLTDFDLDTLVNLPDTTIRKSFVVPAIGGPVEIPPGQAILSQDEDNLIRMNNVQLREVYARSGTLEYVVKSYINGYLDCTYEIPGVSLNGEGAIIQTSTTPGSGSNPFISSGSIDLAGRKIDLTGQNGFMFNRIYTHLNLSSSANAAGQTFVSGNDSISITLKFVDPIVSYARGYFGQHNYLLLESSDFSESLNFPDGLLNLEDVSMNLFIRNAVGVDARVNFNALSNYNDWSQSEVSLEHAPLFEPLNITRAMDANGVVTATEYTFQMNRENSNIDAFVENLPDRFNLSAFIDINPLGDVTDGNDFIYTEDAIAARIDMDIPLNIGMQGLTLVDTLDISSDLVELDAEGRIQLLIENGFPFAASVDLALLDASGNAYQLTNAGTIESAMETSEIGVVQPVHSVIELPVNEEVIQRINDQNKFIVQVVFNTNDYDRTYGLYKNYYLDFKVIANGKVLVRYD